MSTITDYGFYVLDVEAKWIRLALRFYTTTIILLIGLIGDQCCRLLVRRRLLHSLPVRLTHITGWQRGFSPFSMLWHLKTVPGGALMGLLMIFTSLLAIASDLTTAALVVQKPFRHFRPFSGGMVVMPYDNVDTYPDVNGEATLWASNAQYWSEANNCQVGIYRLVDNSSYFCAQVSDILGKWTCEHDTDNPIKFHRTTSVSDVIDSLVNSSKLYPQAMPGEVIIFDDPDRTGDSSTYSQVFAWMPSTSIYGKSWDVRALLDHTPPDDQNERRFDLLHCTVSGTHADSINDVLSQFNASDSLATWSMAVHGAIYQGVRGKLYDYAADIVANYLNSMVMVAASEQNVTRPMNETNPIGRITDVTVVPVPVIVLFFISAALFLGVCGLTLFLFVSCQVSVSYGKQGAKKISRYIPASLIEWMAYALRESEIPAARDAMPKHLKDWDLTAELGGDFYSTQFAKRGEPDYSAVG